MKVYAKLLGVLVVAAFVLASVPAQALTITFGGQNMNTGTGDQSGLSSPVGVDNTNTALPGYFLETFDGSHANGTFPLSNGGTVTVENNGWFTSLNEATDLTVSGSIGIRTGSTTYAAAPGNGNPTIEDYTNYAYAPGQGGSLPVTVLVDYALDLNTILQGYRISYVGLYYGSIDNYNNIAFYSGNTPMTGDPLLQAPTGTPQYGDAAGVLTGAEILASQGGTSGSQYGVGSNVYVNLAFAPSEYFTSFELRTSGVAWEGDNIVVGLSPVPEPATLLLLGLGLVGLAGARRKVKK